MDEALFRNILKQEISSIMSSNGNTSIKPLITRQEAAKFLKVSLPTLGKWTKQGVIKGYYIGDSVRYKYNEIEKSLKEIGKIQ